MSNNTVILLLGTNLNNKKNNLSIAKTYIQEEIGILLSESEIMETKPVGFESDHDFMNQIITISTSFSPLSLLNRIKWIENQMGRVYLPNNQKYQDRIIDIDILFFNELKFKSSRLMIPHHQTKSRDFIKKMLNYYLNR